MRASLTKEQSSEQSSESTQNQPENSPKAQQLQSDQETQRGTSIVNVPEPEGSFHVDAKMVSDTDQLVISDPESGMVFFDSQFDQVDPLLGLDVPYELGESRQLSISIEGAVSINKSIERVQTQFQGLGWVVNPWLRIKDDPASLIGLTQLRADFRDTTANSFEATIACDSVPNASEYQFLLEAPGGFAVLAETTHINGEIKLDKVLDLEPNITYSVRAKAKVEEQWGNFGASHNLTTPDPALCLWLQDSDRNRLVGMGEIIIATPLNPSSQSNLRWKAVRPEDDWEYTYTRNSGSRNFYPHNLVGERYGTKYYVRIQAYVGGVWGEFGPTRMFHVEDFPLTKLSDAYVRQYTNMSTYVYSDPVISQLQSRWEYTALDGSHTTTYLRTSGHNYVNLAWSLLYFNKTYNVRVQVMVGDIWNDYGPSQEISFGPIPTTSLYDSQAGTTVSPAFYLLCGVVAGATNYEWRFTATDGSHTITRQRAHNSNNMPLSWLLIHYGKTYNVEIRVQNNENWGGWGPIKQITIENTSTKLRDSFVDTTVASQGVYLLCDHASGATDYEWEFVATDGSFTATRERNHPTYNLPLSWMYLPYDKTYNVRIRLENAGTWGDWGPVRQFSTPVELSKLRDSYVGLQAHQGVYLYCDAVYGASDYEWEFEATDGSETLRRERNHNAPYLPLGWMVLYYGKTYNVRIRVENAGVFGDWGEVRQIILPVEYGILRSEYVGMTLTTPNVYLYSEPVRAASASEWEFSATDGSHTAGVTRTSSSIYITTGSLNLVDGKTYDVRIKIQNKGIWGEWGEVRQIQTNFA